MSDPLTAYQDCANKLENVRQDRDEWAVRARKAEARVARAERIIAEKNKALGVAFNEMNAILARDGAPQHIDWYKGRPLQTSSCTEEWFAQATDIISAALALTLDEEPSQAARASGAP